MIYHVSQLLHGSATTLIRLEADSFYVDEGMVIFTRETIGDTSRLASFPVHTVRWVVGENLVHGTTFYPQADMVPLPVIDNEELVRAREILRHAPAVLTQDSISPRVPAFPLSEGRLSAPNYEAAMGAASANSSGLSRGAFDIGYDEGQQMDQSLTYNVTDDQEEEPVASTYAPLLHTPRTHGSTQLANAAINQLAPPMRSTPVGFGSANQLSLAEIVAQSGYHSIRPSLNTDAEYRF